MSVVAVTGATGFVGSHCVRVLLERGYTVYGVVRDPNNEEKTAFLRDLPNGKEEDGKLFFKEGNLDIEGSFDEAFMDAEFVVHTAASVVLHAKNPQRDIIDRNVNGMNNVLSSCKNAAKKGKLKRVIITSSVAAVASTSKPGSYVFTEEDYNTTANPRKEPYPFSKYVSETNAQKIVDELEEDEKFSAAFVCPGFILGPLLAKHHINSSPRAFFQLMNGSFAKSPQIGFPISDVRDIARIHIDLMENEELTGRYVSTSGSMFFEQIADVGREHFPNQRFPRGRLPNFLMYIAAVFHPEITFHFLRSSLNKLQQFNSTKVETALGIKHMEMEKSIIDTTQSIIDMGIAEN
eukprot:m.9711 g.9711  ORF g.9711 m.9711 type:complete len:349 (+) comp6396_c0_seq1:28-1074(+)